MTMFDPTGIGAALTSAKTIIDLLRNANDAQLAMKISGEVANLQGRLIDVQQQAIALQDENRELRDEVRQLKAELAESAEAEPCPKCRKKEWEIESSAPDRDFGAVGVSRRVYKCRLFGNSV